MSQCRMIASIGLLFVMAAPVVRAVDATEVRLMAIFAPVPALRIALAPDGRHCAYSYNEGAEWYVVLVDLDSNKETKIRMVPENRELVGLSATEYARLARTPPPTEVSYLHWISANRLVFQTGNAVRAIDADGGRHGRIVDDYDIGSVTSGGGGRGGGMVLRAPRILGPDPTHPGSLIITTAPENPRRAGMDGGVDSFRVDCATAQITRLGEYAEPGTLMFDQSGRARINQSDPTATIGGNPPFLDPQGIRFRYRSGTLNEPVAPLFGMRSWESLSDALGPAGPSVRFDFHADEFFRPRAVPLAFDADPDVLYYSSDVGRDTEAVYALNLKSKTTRLVAEDARSDVGNSKQRVQPGGNSLVFDRSGKLAGVRVRGHYGRTIWLGEQLTAFQKRIDAQFPRNAVEILDWDDAGRRFLVSVYSPAHPGSYRIVEAGDAAVKTLLLLARTDWPESGFNPSEKFAFDTPAKVHLTGTLTRPTSWLVSPQPVVIYCHTLPGIPDGQFDRVTQALATLGFVVVEVNYRGTGGFGAAFRDQFRRDLDAPLEDIRATIDWVAVQFQVDRKRIALVGDELGGYLAIRALEKYPEEFRAAVSRDPPRSISQWENLGGLVNLRSAFLDGAGTGDDSLVRHAADLRRPVMLIEGRNEPGSGERVRSLAAALESDTVKVEVVPNPPSQSLQPDNAWRADVDLFLRIGRFLNAALFDYDVDIKNLRPAEK